MFVTDKELLSMCHGMLNNLICCKNVQKKFAFKNYMLLVSLYYSIRLHSQLTKCTTYKEIVRKQYVESFKLNTYPYLIHKQ